MNLNLFQGIMEETTLCTPEISKTKVKMIVTSEHSFYNERLKRQ